MAFCRTTFYAESFAEIISKNHKIQQIMSSMPDIAISDITVPNVGPSRLRQGVLCQGDSYLGWREADLLSSTVRLVLTPCLSRSCSAMNEVLLPVQKTDKQGRLKSISFLHTLHFIFAKVKCFCLAKAKMSGMAFYRISFLCKICGIISTVIKIGLCKGAG